MCDQDDNRYINLSALLELAILRDPSSVGSHFTDCMGLAGWFPYRHSWGGGTTIGPIWRSLKHRVLQRRIISL